MAAEDILPGLESALEGAAEQGLVADAVIASSEAQTAALWALRENVSEAQKIEGVNSTTESTHTTTQLT